VIDVVNSSSGRRRSNAESALPRNLFAAVVVLGLAAYAASYGPVVDGRAVLGWDVRFAALAALCAAFSLLSRWSPPPLPTVVLSAMGFLDAVSGVVTAADPGWAQTLIVVFTALQAIAGVAALLLVDRASPVPADASGYDAYVDYYNRAVQNYYGQQAQSASPEQLQGAGYGQAYADVRAPSRAQRTQRPSQHGDYADLDYSDTRTAAPQRPAPDSAPAGPTGMPSFGQARTTADRPQGEADRSVRPFPSG
jgi:hypothetical protein